MTKDRDELEPMDPESAVELYLEHKATNCTESTVRNHKYQMKHFLRWCGKEGVDNLNDLSGRDLQSQRVWLSNERDLTALTLRNYLSAVRVFLKWAGSVEAVPEGLYTKLMVPRVRRSQRTNEQILEADEAQETLKYLRKYHYASTEHALLAVLWETGMRVGAANSIDLGDVDVEEQYIELVHRPEQETTLKNGSSGERLIAIRSGLAEVLREFIETIRCDNRDDYGREPLFTTTQGRMHRTTMRRMTNRITAPCFRGDPCPNCNQGEKKKCPEAVSPHAVRRGSITHFLRSDVPVEVVGDRMNVSRDVLDEHYDKRSQEVKLEQRRRFLSNI